MAPEPGTNLESGLEAGCREADSKSRSESESGALELKDECVRRNRLYKCVVRSIASHIPVGMRRAIHESR